MNADNNNCEKTSGENKAKNKTNNKTNNKYDKKNPTIRTSEERRREVRFIIDKLNQLELTMAYDPIRQLFIILQNYVKNGQKIQISIPFPMISKRIKGLLSDTVNEKCWIKLEHEKF